MAPCHGTVKLSGERTVMNVHHCYIQFAFKQVGRAGTEQKPLNHEQKESDPIFCLAKDMNSFNDS